MNSECTTNQNDVEIQRIRARLIISVLAIAIVGPIALTITRKVLDTEIVFPILPAVL